MDTHPAYNGTEITTAFGCSDVALLRISLGILPWVKETIAVTDTHTHPPKRSTT